MGTPSSDGCRLILSMLYTYLPSACHRPSLQDVIVIKMRSMLGLYFQTNLLLWSRGVALSFNLNLKVLIVTCRKIISLQSPAAMKSFFGNSVCTQESNAHREIGSCPFHRANNTKPGLHISSTHIVHHFDLDSDVSRICLDWHIDVVHHKRILWRLENRSSVASETISWNNRKKITIDHVLRTPVIELSLISVWM